MRLNAAANAETIRLTDAADAERLQSEAAVLKQNPMLDSENYRRAPLGQVANHHGAD